MRPVATNRGTFDPRVLHDHSVRIEHEHTAIEIEGEDCKFFEDARENERSEARFDLMKDLSTANHSEPSKPKNRDDEDARRRASDWHNAKPPWNRFHSLNNLDDAV
jgi:hypothetical protein